MTILVGDCREVMAGMEPESIDAIVCDPPYGLEFMGKEWDKFVPDDRRNREWDGRRRNDTSDKWTPKAKERSGKGGAGPSFSVASHYKPNTKCRICDRWEFDKNPCTCDEPQWTYRPRQEAPTQLLGFQGWNESWAREAFRVLKPGGHLLAFGGTRTFHRLTVAIEDSGFEIRDCLSWLYGSGFPKSLDVSKAITAHQTTGSSSRVANRRAMTGDQSRSTSYGSAGNERAMLTERTTPPPRANLTPEAEQWAGWGTALKPAYEPVIVARKPADIRYTLRSLVPMIEEQLCKVDTFAKTDTHLSELLQASGYSNIASLLSRCLADLSNPESRYTTETATALITDLTTLRSYLSALMPSSTTQDVTEPNGIASSAWFAVAISASVVAKCERLVSITAGESATDQPVDQDSDPEERLRPNWEPIIVARKPLIGTVAANVLQHGTGAINVDATRIGTTVETWPASRSYAPGQMQPGHVGQTQDTGPVPQGRWPANVLLSHHEDCRQIGTRRVKGSNPVKPGGGQCEKGYTTYPNGGIEYAPKQRAPHDFTDPDGMETVAAWECHPDCAVAMLDVQSGERGKSAGVQRMSPASGIYGGLIQRGDPTKDGQPIGYGDTGGASRFFYTAKASRSERNAGLEGMPERDTQRYGSIRTERGAGYEADSKHTNHHPTVKPIALMRWLVRLVTPPGGTILDPFAGSGSTGCAAVLEGFDFIGIEQDAEYAGIAERRIAYWAANGDRPVKAKAGDTGRGVYSGGRHHTVARCPDHDEPSGGRNHYRCGCPIAYAKGDRRQPRPATFQPALQLEGAAD